MNRRQFNCVALGLAVAAAGADAALARDAGLSAAGLFDRLEGFGFSGGAFIVEAGRPVFKRSCGWADRALGEPFRFDTPFNIASVTKPLTALTVLKLAEEGALAPQDPLGRFLPAAPADKAKLTLAQLMSHSSGLPRSVPMDDTVDRDALLQRILEVELIAAPGARFAYSNIGYCLLAAVIETVTGGTYREAVRRRIFEPAGMIRSGFEQDYRTTRPVAHGYDEWKDVGAFPTTHRRGWFDGPGNIVSTLGDMVRLTQAIETGRLVSARSLASAMIAHSPSTEDDGYDSYGYGWYLGKALDGSPLSAHSGDSVGYHSELRWYPQARRWIYLVATKELYDSSGFGLGVHARVISNDLERLRTGAPVKAPPALRPGGRRVLDSLVGDFPSQDGAGRISVLRRDPRDPALTAFAVGQRAADALSGADAVGASENAAANARALALADLIRAEDGAGLKAALGSRDFFAAGWVETFRAWREAHGSFVGFGPLTSRHTPFGDPQIRTFAPFRFERGEEVLEFTWAGTTLFETLTGRGLPSPVIAPVAPVVGEGFATYDMVTRKALPITLDGADLLVGGVRFGPRAG